MSERELVRKANVINKLWGTGLNQRHLQIMEELPTITEEEIVKPYLEAIEAEAIKYSGTGEREVQAYDEGLLKAIEIIKKLLSEQEVKEWDTIEEARS